MVVGSMIAFAALGGAVLICDSLVARAGAWRTHASSADVPPTDVALVLGTNPRVNDGRENLFFRYRIEAAAELFHAGRVRHLLVSGDNHIATYDEPGAMRDALITKGVPAGAITLDYAGFRTLDSVFRARSVFGQQRIVVVSQAFHCERAIYLARRHGIDAIGFAAQQPGGAAGGMVRARETLARCAAVIDGVIGRGPRFTGPSEPIRLAGQ
ncbi:MAG: vancomycin high temperature exclusion protein [Phycisphaerales bacterium]